MCGWAAVAEPVWDPQSGPNAALDGKGRRSSGNTIPSGWRPSRMASTISGARRVSCKIRLP